MTKWARSTNQNQILPYLKTFKIDSRCFFFLFFFRIQIFFRVNYLQIQALKRGLKLSYRGCIRTFFNSIYGRFFINRIKLIIKQTLRRSQILQAILQVWQESSQLTLTLQIRYKINNRDFKEMKKYIYRENHSYINPQGSQTQI